MTLAPARHEPAGAQRPQPERFVLSLFDETTEAKVLFDANAVVAAASGATPLLFAIEAAALPGHAIASLPVGIGQPLTQVAHHAFVNRAPAEAELSLVRVDGYAVAVHAKGSPLLENDAVLGVGITLRDSASPRVLEAASAGNLPGALEAAAQSPFAVFFLDSRGNCIGTNDIWTAVTGLSAEASTAQGWVSMVEPSALDSFRRIAVIAHRNTDGWRTQLPHASSSFALDVAAAPVLDPNGGLVGYVGFATPVALASAYSSASAEPAPAPSPFAAPADEAPTAVSRMGVPLPAPNAPTSLNPHVLSDIGNGIGTAAPIQPVEKHRLPSAADASTWRPPTLEAGFTDPSLLVSSRAEAPQSSAAVAEPGTDRVTGLPNRLLFAQHVAATIERIKTDALTVAVSFVDLEGIRAQRNIAGSRVANDSLFLLAKRLESTIRSIEIAGAVSEDIFAVLSINWLFAEDLPIVARRLLGRLEEPLAGREGEFVVKMRLGMSIARPGDSVEALFSRAAAALDEASKSTDHYFIEGI